MNGCNSTPHTYESICVSHLCVGKIKMACASEDDLESAVHCFLL